MLEADELLAGPERVAQHQHQAGHGQRHAQGTGQRRDQEAGHRRIRPRVTSKTREIRPKKLAGEFVGGGEAHGRHGEGEVHGQEETGFRGPS